MDAPAADSGAPTRDVQDLEVLITAEEAYPAMERAFLGAETEIWASYRVFDPFTKLRSEEGKAVGETWYDLLIHTLNRGVTIHMVLSDFDPILAPDLHCASWNARRAFVAAREAARPEAGKLHIVNAAHSGRVGLLPRLLLWPALLTRLRRLARELNGMTSEARAARLTCSPGLRPWLKEGPGGTLTAAKWPPPPLIPGSHHQKIAVFDRKLLCVGGLDLDERRYDDKGHHRARDETWHDVQMMCRGPVAQEAQNHLENFLEVVAGTAQPLPRGRLLRTLSRKRRLGLPFLGPRPLVDELAEAHHRMIRGASRLIYLETQFFRDRRLAGALAEAAARRPDLGLIMVLPGAPEDVAFDGATGPDARFGEYLQAKCVAQITEAFGPRLALCSPVRPIRVAGSGRDTLCNSPIIYVHAKVSIFDADHAVISSANLNGRSFRWDTEAGVMLELEQEVAGLRHRILRHWLWDGAGDDYFDLDTAAARWRDLVAANGTKDPEDRDGYLVPHDPEPARAFGRPIPGLPHAMV